MKIRKSEHIPQSLSLLRGFYWFLFCFMRKSICFSFPWPVAWLLVALYGRKSQCHSFSFPFLGGLCFSSFFLSPFFFPCLLMLHFQYLGDKNYLNLCSPVLCHMVYAKVFHTPLHYQIFELVKHSLFFAPLDFFIC